MTSLNLTVAELLKFAGFCDTQVEAATAIADIENAKAYLYVANDVRKLYAALTDGNMRSGGST